MCQTFCRFGLLLLEGCATSPSVIRLTALLAGVSQSFLPWTPTVDGVVLDVEPLTALVVSSLVLCYLSLYRSLTHDCLPQQTAQTSPIPIMAGSTLNASTMLVYTEFPEPVSSVLYSSVSKGGSGTV